MSHNRRSLFRWIGFLLLLPIATQQQVAVFGEDSTPSAASNQLLQATYGRYQQESLQLKPENRAKFLTFWEEEFRKTLAVDGGDKSLRLRMMDELGAILRAGGKNDEALKAYKQMTAYAKEVNDLESKVIAAENQLELSANEPIEDFKQAAETYESGAKELANQRDDPALRKKYCDSIVRIGTLLFNRSQKAGGGAPEAELLEHAEALFEQSAAMGDASSSPLATRMWWLAQSQSRLGNRDAAAATYGKIATMDQKVLSRLWMEFLRIGEITSKDSPEYRTAIETALKEFDERGGVDDYEVTMRHELGLSYRIAGQFDKSTEILSAIIGKSSDSALSAYDMWLVSQNYSDAGDPVMAKSILRDLAKQYPDTSLAASVRAELKESEPSVTDIADSKLHASRKWAIIGVNALLVVFGFLYFFFIAKRKSAAKS